MRILVGGLKQETNTFSPVLCDLDSFKQTGYAEGNDVLDNSDGSMNGILSCIREHGDEAIPTLMMRGPACGYVKQSAADIFIENVIATFDRERPDAIFLSMHGGMAIDHGYDDGTGYIYSKIREHVGSDLVIVAAQDMHANVTKVCMENVNAIAGFQTYPHVDLYETGYRAATMGYQILYKKPFSFACVRVPMIVPAEGYSSLSGVFKELLDEGHVLVKSGEILDFSVFQMQPWLNVNNAASAVTVAAEDPVTAEKYAKHIAQNLFSIRKDMKVELYPMDEVIDIALNNETEMPVILVDSADSPNAGSSADSSAVLQRLLERDVDLKCAISLNDAPASDKAYEVGVGNVAEFELGGTLDPYFQKSIKVTAYVKSLHDGRYRNTGATATGAKVNVGKTAVLRVKNIDIVVMRYMTYSYDLQSYRAFGVDPALYDLVVVKSANAYKANYSQISNLFYPTDTPGASTANLQSLPFTKIPRPFFPFDDIDVFDDTVIFS